jgi:hypothetical protein
MRAIAFDLDANSLASLREALPGWEIERVDGATPAWLAEDWNPGAVDLLVISSQDEAARTLGLCRFLASGWNLSRESRTEQAAGPHRQNQPRRSDVPLLVLVPSEQERLVRAALEAGADSCLILPFQAKEIGTMLARVQRANQPGRHTLNLDPAQHEDHWRDDGGQG